MTQEAQVTPPPVLWAQRSDILYLTISVEDCKDPTIKVEENSLFFKGVGGTEQKPYEVTINFFKEVNPEKVVQSVKGRNIELVITKKEEGPFWDRLCKETTKFHWLKADFNKWKDEDDSEDEGGAPDFGGLGGDFGGANPFANLGGGLGGGLGGLGGLGGDKPDFNEEEEDSDDEEIPDLE